MWVRLQATSVCGSCVAASPVNAAIGEATCQSCGARSTLLDGLWDTAWTRLIEVVAELPPHAATSQTFEQDGGQLRFQAARVDPTCPHCDEAWAPDAPAEPFDCPSCGESISVRPRSGVTLIGEDRELLAGRGGTPTTETVACDSCAAPLSVDGHARSVTCESCGSANVLSDELYRRLHAPRLVAKWYLWSDAPAAGDGIGPLIDVASLASGGSRLFLTGRHGDVEEALLAIDLDPPRLAWMVDLSEHDADAPGTVSVAADGTLLWCDQDGRIILRFDPETGKRRGRLAHTEAIYDVVGDVDGTLVVITRMDGTFPCLTRLGAGAVVVPTWPPRGLLARMFGGTPAPGKPTSRMTVFVSGRIGMGLDGALRVATSTHLCRLARNGTLSWSVQLGETAHTQVVPAATPDGTTFGVYELEEDDDDGNTIVRTHLIRVDPGGAAFRSIARSPATGEAWLQFGPVAASPDGSVWLATRGAELRHLDRDGNLIWQRAGPSQE